MTDLSFRYAFAYFTPIIVRVSQSITIKHSAILTILIEHGLYCWCCQSSLSASCIRCCLQCILLCLDRGQIPHPCACYCDTGDHLFCRSDDNCIPQEQYHPVLWNFPRKRRMPGKHPSRPGISIEQHSLSIQEIGWYGAANGIRSHRWHHCFNGLPRSGRTQISEWALDDGGLADPGLAAAVYNNVCFLAS
jgi:hypothetical protein